MYLKSVNYAEFCGTGFVISFTISKYEVWAVNLNVAVQSHANEFFNIYHRIRLNDR